ncbi:MAG: GNAT family N-acetyltransferase [Paludibacter sp.]|nr:GNAT family N-acetyltransferase [Paludibacter sp.]
MINSYEIIEVPEKEIVVSPDISILIGKPNKSFFSQYVNQVDNDFFEPLSNRVDIDSYADKINKLSTTFVLFYKGDVAGLIASYFYDISSLKGFITLVHIKDEFRRIHLSEYLVSATQSYAKSLNFLYIDLMVFKQNLSAYNLYKKCGFLVINEFDEKYLMRWSNL